MDTLNMDTRKLEILKNDTAIMLSLAEPGAGGDIIARIDPSTCNAEALREVRRRHNNFPALVEALKAWRYAYSECTGTDDERRDAKIKAGDMTRAALKAASE